MTKEEFISLAEKVSDGSANSRELELYNRYFNAYQQASPAWNLVSESEKEEIKDILSGRIHQHIHPTASPKQVRLWPRWVAAAAILFIVAVGVYFYQQQSILKKDTSIAQQQDFTPGGNKAFLTLSNGKRIDLNASKNTTLAENGGISISKTADGQLIYEIKEETGDVIGNNTIETPKGGQYQIKLPDGTMVWLNASSSMTYPVRFTGAERLVEITGEAYFEVAHNAQKPFIVKSRQQRIEVLGTHFNVMAYGDEIETKTTLLEGSVKVMSPKKQLLLKPGQQSSVSVNGASLEEDVDIDGVVAWKNGKILLNDMSIQHIMRSLSRWYNFEVEYQGNAITTTFGGSFSRTKNLSTILRSLESTGDVHFKIEGRRIIVMP
jgi:transmembrane sensor